MPIAPKPYKYKCPKCNYSEIVKPKSDVIFFKSDSCPKCNSKMEIVELSMLEKVLYSVPF